MPPRNRAAFTLVEMLAVIAILVLIAGMSLFALWGANEEAKADRTRSIIRKVDVLIDQQWDSYSTRRVAIAPGLESALNSHINGVSTLRAQRRAFARVAAIRELQRMELPERKTDIENGRTVLANNPALWLNYRRRCMRQLGETVPNSGIINFANWTPQYQGSECLYLIMASLSDGDRNGLDFFKPTEIGDLDNDNMPEVLDAWRRPIDFIRWPAGYLSNPVQAWAAPSNSGPPASCIRGPVVPVSTEQFAPYYSSFAPMSAEPPRAPDRHDPLRADPRWHDISDPSAGTTDDPELARINDTYELRPLVYSGGPDRFKNIDSDANPPVTHSNISSQLAVTGNMVFGGGYPSAFYRNDPYQFYKVDEECPAGSGNIVRLTFQLGTPRENSEFGSAADNITNHFTEAQ